MLSFSTTSGELRQNGDGFEHSIELLDNYRKAYGADLRAFAAWLDDRQRDVEQTTRFDLRRYLVELEEQGLAATSVQRKLASLRALFLWLHERGAIDPRNQVVRRRFEHQA